MKTTLKAKTLGELRHLSKWLVDDDTPLSADVRLTFDKSLNLIIVATSRREESINVPSLIDQGEDNDKE